MQHKVSFKSAMLDSGLVVPCEVDTGIEVTCTDVVLAQGNVSLEFSLSPESDLYNVILHACKAGVETFVNEETGLRLLELWEDDNEDCCPTNECLYMVLITHKSLDMGVKDLEFNDALKGLSKHADIAITQGVFDPLSKIRLLLDVMESTVSIALAHHELFEMQKRK